MADSSFRIKSGSLNLKPQATPPANPEQGDLYVDDSGVLQVYDGASFAPPGGGGGNGEVKVSVDDTVPDFLFNKISVVAPITKELINPFTAEEVQIALDVDDVTIEIAPILHHLRVRDYGLFDVHISTTAGIAYSKLNLTSSVQSGDLDPAISIDYVNLNLSSSIVDADISTIAGIQYNKLSLSSSLLDGDIIDGAGIQLSKLATITSERAVSTDPFGFLTASVTTSAELDFLSGVTSGIQTQLGDKLDLTGGSVTGQIAMGSQKITNLANPTDPADAATKEYVDNASSGPSVPEWDVDHVVSNDTDIANAVQVVSDANQSVATGERVLFRGQVADSENGIYIYSAFGIAAGIEVNGLVQSEDLSGLTWGPLTGLDYGLEPYDPFPGEDTSVGLGISSPNVTEAYIDSTQQYLIARTTASNIFWIIVKASSPGQDFVNDSDAASFDYSYRVALTDGTNVSDSTLVDSIPPVSAAVDRASDADASAEFVVNKKVVSPSGLYKYSGIVAPTIDTTSLPFDLAVPFPWEYSAATALGNIANKNIVLTSTSAITIGSIENSNVVILNRIDVAISGDISNSKISGADISDSSDVTMTFSGSLIKNSEIRWVVDVLSESARVLAFSGAAKRITGCSISATRINASVTADYFNCDIIANLIVVTSAVTWFSSCQVFPRFLRCSSGTMRSSGSFVRAGLVIQESTGEVDLAARTNLICGRWDLNGSNGLTVSTAENSANISVFSWSGSGGLQADNDGAITIARMILSSAKSVTTPTSGFISVGIFTGATLNTYAASSRLFTSFNNTHLLP